MKMQKQKHPFECNWFIFVNFDYFGMKEIVQRVELMYELHIGMIVVVCYSNTEGRKMQHSCRRAGCW